MFPGKLFETRTVFNKQPNAYMTYRISVGLVGEFAGKLLDFVTLAEILAGVAESGTLRAAADRLALSYRGVWGKLELAHEALGQALVIKSKGHGSSLTPAGEQLLRLVRDMRQRAQDAAQREIAPLDEELRHLLALGRPSLRLACSHDVLLADCASGGLLDGWELRFMGSQKALDALESGKVNLAGFHLPENVPGMVAFENLFVDPRYFVQPLMRREQGLIVACGNPLNIRAIDDLVRPEVRFINRQRGAGTRMWLDHLLRSRGLDPAAIKGYGREEFTHFAVAAAVAAGAADVAFAQRAATAGLAVDFIPVGCETYFICGARQLGRDARVRDFIDTVARRLAGHSGYAAADPPAGERRQA